MSNLDKIRQIADEVGGTVTEDYSGRHMYGARCVAIDCSDELDVIERAAVHGLERPRIDHLGKGFICYWPDVKGARS